MSDRVRIADGRPAFVTGAAGFVGGRLADRLIGMGIPVRGLVRKAEQAARLEARGAHAALGDLTRGDTLADAVRGCDIVFHCAAWMGRPHTREAAVAVNVEGTRRLLRAALDAGIRRFVHVSTISVYGPTTSDVIDEQTPLWPLGLYRETKIEAEREVAKAQHLGLATVILRPGQIFGPDDTGWSPAAIRLLRRGLPLVVDGGHGFCYPIYVENLVDALLSAGDMDGAVGEVMNLADADVPWREFFGYYAAMVGRHLRSFPSWAVRLITTGAEIVSSLTRRPPRWHRTELGYLLRTSRYSTARARAVLRWSPRVPLNDAMRQTEIWLRQSGMLPEPQPAR
ncbi:MAG: NAD-dependent epimerase/dehydratase family protein [bacterium]